MVWSLGMNITCLEWGHISEKLQFLLYGVSRYIWSSSNSLFKESAIYNYGVSAEYMMDGV